MHFIEQWLGLSPDGGSGAFEALILVLFGAALVLAARRAHRRERRRR
jgi:hypothetical protein